MLIKGTEKQAGVVHDIISQSNNKKCYVPTVHFCYGIVSTVRI